MYKVRKELIDLMIEKKGRDYTFGWLASAYVNQMDENAENIMAEKFLTELKSISTEAEDAND